MSDDQDVRLVVDRGATCFTVLDVFPYASGHVMVAPPHRRAGGAERRRNRRDHGAPESGRSLGEVMNPAGFNVGLKLGTAAGAGIADHLHLPVVPRWQGNATSMSLLSDTHVIRKGADRHRERPSRLSRDDLGQRRDSGRRRAFPPSGLAREGAMDGERLRQRGRIPVRRPCRNHAPRGERRAIGRRPRRMRFRRVTPS